MGPKVQFTLGERTGSERAPPAGPVNSSFPGRFRISPYGRGAVGTSRWIKHGNTHSRCSTQQSGERAGRARGPGLLTRGTLVINICKFEKSIVLEPWALCGDSMVE